MRPARDSLREYTRGVIGGLIFSLPLLYTMEVWWAGIQLSSLRMLVMVGLTAMILVGYNTYAGVRPTETWAGVMIDSVEEFGLGLVVSASALGLLGRIEPSDPLREIVGKVVLEALLVAIGISVGTAQMTSQDSSDEESLGKRPTDLWGILIVSICGAVVIATNIAITDEVVILALESSSLRLLGLVIVSLVLSAMILVFSDLLETKAQGGSPTELRKFLFGITLSYAVAFVVSGLILYLFGRFDGVALHPCVAMTIVLTTASILGASAGKILL